MHAKILKHIIAGKMIQDIQKVVNSVYPMMGGVVHFSYYSDIARQ